MAIIALLWTLRLGSVFAVFNDFDEEEDEDVVDVPELFSFFCTPDPCRIFSAFAGMSVALPSTMGRGVEAALESRETVDEGEDEDEEDDES